MPVSDRELGVRADPDVPHNMVFIPFCFVSVRKESLNSSSAQRGSQRYQGGFERTALTATSSWPWPRPGFRCRTCGPKVAP
jgi:hypothetical protein